MNNIRLNISFKNINKWKDSEKRSEHVFDRMQSRGIGREQIIEAVRQGSKKIREDGSIVAEFRWFKVVYREFRVDSTIKIYPITVFEV